MDFDNPVIAKLFDKHFGARLAEQVEEELTKKVTIATQEMQQKFTAAIQQLNEANRREMHQRETEFRLQQAEAEAARQRAEAEAARREAEAEAARREAEAARREAETEATRREAETEATRREAEAEATRREAEVKAQWQQLMLKLLENRFQTIPPAILSLLQNVSSPQRNQASDIIFAAPDAQQCLQSLRQLGQSPDLQVLKT